jgi:hypothetical protein
MLQRIAPLFWVNVVLVDRISPGVDWRNLFPSSEAPSAERDVAENAHWSSLLNETWLPLRQRFGRNCT